MAAQTTVFRTHDEGPVHEVLGMRHVYKATAADTGGSHVSWELEIPPGCGAPPHRHAVDSESFYVLDGEIRFTDASGTRVARRGEFVLLPAGGVHAFENASDAPARAFVISTPGVEAERFFAALDARGAELSGPAEVTEIAARHGITLVPPAG
jgi:quercetin dioxygenase-like cupin family protein